MYALKEVLEKNGHDVELFGSYEKENLVNSITRFFNLRYYFLMGKKIKSFKPDIVHFHNISRILSPSVVLAAVKNGIKLVQTIHDYQNFCPRTWGIYSDGVACKLGISLKCIYSNCIAERTGCKYLFYQNLRLLKVLINRIIIKRYIDTFICPSKDLTHKFASVLKSNNVCYLPNFSNIDVEQTNNKSIRRTRIKV